jgi:hypothetical protein
MATPTRFPAGVSTQKVNQTLGMFGQPDPTDPIVDFHDFQQYVAADWTVTNTTTHATVGLTAGAGGLISLAGGASSVTNDIAAIISNPLDFNFTSGQQVWFYTGFKVTTVANDQIQLGITAANSALTPSDGIYFNKAAGASTIDFVVRKSSTSTTQSAVATLVNATFVRLGFYYNGKDAVDVFVNDNKVYSQTVLTNLPTSTALALALGLKAAATAPTTSDLIVDFLMAAQDRSY